MLPAPRHNAEVHWVLRLARQLTAHRLGQCWQSVALSMLMLFRCRGSNCSRDCHENGVQAALLQDIAARSSLRVPDG